MNKSMKIIGYVLMALISNTSLANKTLLDWNTGENQDIPGWVWKDDIGYGISGWELLYSDTLGSGEQFLNGWAPRSMNKTDYGKENTATIDALSRAPSTKTGGSLLITALDGGDSRATWWVWYDGKPLKERGVTDSNTDRMSLYIKAENLPSLPEDIGKPFPSTTIDIGTYLCWTDTSIDNPGSGTGKGCPYEGPGNQHYYHFVSTNSGAWIHLLLDQNPQHLRGAPSTAGNNPSLITDGKSYFEHLNQFYIQTAIDTAKPAKLWIDEIYFYSTQDTKEPLQNDISISSLWVGYWADTDMWQLGFNDADLGSKTYEVRWSTSEITNQNYHMALPVEPQVFGGVNATGDKNLFRRPNEWLSAAWIKFKLPIAEENYDKIYFAVKDVSSIGKHVGNIYPWKGGDNKDANNSLVKTIDYSLSPSSKPKAPNDITVTIP